MMYDSDNDAERNFGALKIENKWIVKQVSNAKNEILTVRHILVGSEKDRLNERKEKLKVVRKMIDLTKEKTSLNEQLQSFKDNNHFDKNEYVRLYEKYEQALEKIRYLRENCAMENERVQKGYIDDLKKVKLDYEKGIQEFENESNHLKNSMKELMTSGEEGNTTSSIEDIKKDFPEIIDAMSEKGLVNDSTTSRQVIMNLFHEYKRLFNDIKMKMDTSLHGDSIKNLEIENKELKKLLDEKQNDVTEKQTRFQISEDLFKSQIDDLLSQKTKAVLEKEIVKDEIESIKEDSENIKLRLQNTKEVLSKRTGQLTVAQENLVNVTDEMKMLEARFESIQRQILVKDAEILRLQQDLEDEKSRRISAEEQLKSFQKNQLDLKQDEMLLSQTKIQYQLNITDLQKTIDGLKKELSATGKEKNQITQKCGEFEEKNEEFLKELTGIKREFDKNEILIKTLQEQNSLLQRNFEEETGKRCLAEESLKAQEDRSDLLEEIQKHKKTIDDMNQILKEREEMIASNAKEINAKEVAIEDLSKKLQKISQDNERQSKELASQQKSMENLCKEDFTPEKMNVLESVHLHAMLDEDFIVPSLEERQHSQPPHKIEEDFITPVTHQEQEEIPTADEIDWIINNTPLQEKSMEPFTDISYTSPLQFEESTMMFEDVKEEHPSQQKEKDNFKTDIIVEDDMEKLRNENHEKNKKIEELSAVFQQQIKENELLSKQLEKLETQNQSEILQDDIKNVRNENLEKSKKIEELSNVLQQKTEEKELLSKQLESEKISKEEGSETVHCLKVLVADNEAYVKCIAEQQNFISSLKDENVELRRKLNETIISYEDEFTNTLREKAKLKNVMMNKSMFLANDQLFVLQKQEIETLKCHFEESRAERKKLEIELEERTSELERTQNDLNTMKSAIEYNLESERRSKEYVEEQLKLVVQDRGHTLIKLKSTELANKLLQNKLRDLQKWHNDMEFQLLNDCQQQSKSLEIG